MNNHVGYAPVADMANALAAYRTFVESFMCDPYVTNPTNLV